MSVQEWVLAGVYIVMSVLLALVSMWLMAAGYAELGKGLLVTFGAYAIGMPILYGIYRWVVG